MPTPLPAPSVLSVTREDEALHDPKAQLLVHVVEVGGLLGVALGQPLSGDEVSGLRVRWVR